MVAFACKSWKSKSIYGRKEQRLRSSYSEVYLAGWRHSKSQGEDTVSPKTGEDTVSPKLGEDTKSPKTNFIMMLLANLFSTETEAHLFEDGDNDERRTETESIGGRLTNLL